MATSLLIAVLQTARDTVYMTPAHDGLATAHQASGVPAKARHHWQQALALYIDLGAPETQRIRAHLTVDGHLPTSRPTGSLST